MQEIERICKARHAADGNEQGVKFGRNPNGSGLRKPHSKKS